MSIGSHSANCGTSKLNPGWLVVPPASSANAIAGMLNSIAPEKTAATIDFLFLVLTYSPPVSSDVPENIMDIITWQ
jgi:hypothetical protein